MSNGCSLFVKDGSGETPTVDIVGEIDLASAPEAYSAMWRASKSGRRSLIINLEGLDFMDSSGLQTFLRLREKLHVRKQTITLIGAQPQIRKVFRLTGFDKLFPFAEEGEK